MKNLLEEISGRLSEAIVAAFGDELAGTDPIVTPAGNPEFGDYQANVAMSLARTLRKKPRDIAEEIVAAARMEDIAESLSVAGPGFINVGLKAEYLAGRLADLAEDERVGVPVTDVPQTVVVDYSSPNVAKEMHVGHIRSTAIGDAIARVLGFLGHRVIRQNHVGDWGTQFGMLLEHLLDEGWDPAAGSRVSDLDELYRAAKRRDDDDPEFSQRARKRVTMLQGGDPETIALWRSLIEESKRHFNEIYERLGVKLTDDDIRGESFYNDRLPGVIEALADAGILVTSEGAEVVFPEGFKDRDGNPLPMIVRKSDGGFLYSTTDLAAVRHRLDELGADRIVYVVDARQSDHFKMLFAVASMAGWLNPDHRLEHVAFGTILGADHRPFKTREGGTVKLAALLDQAVAKAEQIVAEKSPGLPADTRREIAEAVGVGALKFGDLAGDRIKDYVFDLDRMLAMDGRTAPYLQNAHVRTRGIFRKGGIDAETVRKADIRIDAPTERALALTICRLPEVLTSVGESLEPHRLCNYLYETATAFHRFYEQCPVLAAEEEATRASRLALCDITARTLELGLSLLGIAAPDRM